MNPTSQTSRRNSPRVPVQFTVLAEMSGHRVLMYSENISLDGMFLRTSSFIAPHSVFGAQLWLTSDEEPLRVYLTSCFIERTPAEYGIGVYISGISSDDRAHWEKFYRCCVEAQVEQQALLAPSRRTIRNRHIAVVNEALNQQSISALRVSGLEVSQVSSANAAIELVETRQIDAVICNLQGPTMDGLNLCYTVSSRGLHTRPVLLTDSAASMEFWMGAQAGAVRVIAKPCSPQLLVSRIAEVLAEPLPAARRTAAVERMEDQVMGVCPRVNWLADTVSHPSESPRPELSRRAGRYLGQVYRYLASRMAGSYSHRATPHQPSEA